jgi:TATA-box binding protein (TBP) (component of TFIID and TFIIIB)
MAAPSTFSGYFARCGRHVSGSVSTLLQKRVAGASTTVGTESGYPLWSFGDVARLEISGTGLTVFRNGVSVLTGTDSTHTSGRGGMMLNSAFAVSGSETARLDDFEVGDIATVGGAGTRRRVVGIQ